MLVYSDYVNRLNSGSNIEGFQKMSRVFYNLAGVITEYPTHEPALSELTVAVVPQWSRTSVNVAVKLVLSMSIVP